MGWLSGWSYRKSHAVSGATGAGTDYTVKIIIHSGSGSDSGEDVYLNNHCSNFPNDIRFTDDDGTTELDHWCEDLTADPATFWVKVNDDLGSNQSIYVYYGKSGAASASASDLDDVFLCGDNFDDNSLDTSKWNVVEGSVTETGGQLVLVRSGGAGGLARGKTTWHQASIGCAVHSKSMVDTTGHWAYFNAITDDEAGGGGADKLRWAFYVTGSCFRCTSVNDGSSTHTNSDAWDTNWHHFEIQWYDDSGTPTNKFYKDDTLEATHTTNVPTNADNDLTFFFRSNANYDDTLYVEYAFVRKFVSPEPSHGAWGSEETLSLAHSFGYIIG